MKTERKRSKLNNKQVFELISWMKKNEFRIHGNSIPLREEAEKTLGFKISKDKFHALRVEFGWAPRLNESVVQAGSSMMNAKKIGILARSLVQLMRNLGVTPSLELEELVHE